MNDPIQLTLTEAGNDYDTRSALALPVPCVACGGSQGREYVYAGGRLIRACLCGNVQSVYLPATESGEVSDVD